MATALATPELKATDRCDACGAQAYVLATLPSGGQLTFCAHHARTHGERLRAMSAEITDESARLNDKA